MRKNTNMIKVVQFIHGLNMGGAEKVVKDYATLLNKEEFDVTVLCYEHFKDSPYESLLKENGIRTICICDEMPLSGKCDMVSKGINKFQRYYLIKKYLKKLQPDIVHVHLQLNDYIKYAHLNQNTKIFYTQHFAVDCLKKNYPEQIRYLKWIKQHYDLRLIALNEEMRKSLNNLFSTNNTVVINNGIDFVKYKTDFKRQEKRQELKIPQDAFVVCHIGRFDPVKNHDFLIDVFEQIKYQIPKAFLVMVGKGKTEEAVRSKLIEKGLMDSTLILNDRADVDEILRTSDGAVFPSISEGLGISVIEMQAAGLPCVVSEAVPVETVISNKMRFCNLNDSPKTWADMLISLTEDKEMLRYTNTDEWDIHNSIRKLEKMYEEACK